MKQVKLQGRELKITEAFASGELSANAYRAVVAKLRGQLTMIEEAIAEVHADPRVLLDKLTRVLAQRTRWAGNQSSSTQTQLSPHFSA